MPETPSGQYFRTSTSVLPGERTKRKYELQLSTSLVDGSRGTLKCIVWQPAAAIDMAATNAAAREFLGDTFMECLAGESTRMAHEHPANRGSSLDCPSRQRVKPHVVRPANVASSLL